MSLSEFVTAIVAILGLVLSYGALYWARQEVKAFKEQNALMRADLLARNVEIPVTTPNEARRVVPWRLYAPLVGAAICMAVIVIAVGLDIYGRHFTFDETITHEPTKLQLQFNDLGQPPQSIAKVNVWRFNSVDFKIQKDVIDPQGLTVMSEAQYTLLLFLVFDKPIAVKDLRVSGHGAFLPMHEIKDLTSRSAFIVFDGPVARTVLDVEATF